MGLVTSLMIAAVVYTKVIMPQDQRTLTLGESRALDRVCQTRCSDLADKIARKTRTEEELIKKAKACVADCLVRVQASRLSR